MLISSVESGSPTMIVCTVLWLEEPKRPVIVISQDARVGVGAPVNEHVVP